MDINLFSTRKFNTKLNVDTLLFMLQFASSLVMAQSSKPEKGSIIGKITITDGSSAQGLTVKLKEV